MKDTHDQSVTVNTTETAATAPARLAALEILAGLTDRNLALFHYEKARALFESLEHEIRTYGDDDEPDAFVQREAGVIAVKIEKIIGHLSHVQAISTESAQRAATSLPEPA